MMFIQQFLASILNTFKVIFKDKGVFLILIGAPLLYCAYYPLAYKNEFVRNIPVAVVDYANDEYSRKVITSLQGANSLNIEIYPSEHKAENDMLKGKLMAFVILNPHLEKNILGYKKAVINVVGSGAYLLAAKNALKEVADRILDIGSSVEIHNLKLKGLSDEKAEAITNPVISNVSYAYNNNQGYGHYVVSGAFWLILQQTLLISSAMFIGVLGKTKSVRTTGINWIGRIFTFSIIHYLVCFFYLGWVFYYYGYSQAVGFWANFALVLIFSPAIASVGMLIGLKIKDRDRAIEFLIFSSMPMFFLSGYSWPLENLPFFLKIVAYLLPSTFAIDAGVKINQLGAGFDAISGDLIALLGLAIVSLTILIYLGREKIEKLNE